MSGKSFAGKCNYEMFHVHIVYCILKNLVIITISIALE